MMKEKIGIDDFILACWDIDNTGWKIRVNVDLWAEAVAVSEKLGHFRAVSEYASDIEETLARLLDRIKEANKSC